MYYYSNMFHDNNLLGKEQKHSQLADLSYSHRHLLELATVVTQNLQKFTARWARAGRECLASEERKARTKFLFCAAEIDMARFRILLLATLTHVSLGSKISLFKSKKTPKRDDSPHAIANPLEGMENRLSALEHSVAGIDRMVSQTFRSVKELEEKLAALSSLVDRLGSGKSETTRPLERIIELIEPLTSERTVFESRIERQIESIKLFMQSAISESDEKCISQFKQIHGSTIQPCAGVPPPPPPPPPPMMMPPPPPPPPMMMPLLTSPDLSAQSHKTPLPADRETSDQSAKSSARQKSQASSVEGFDDELKRIVAKWKGKPTSQLRESRNIDQAEDDA